jgi:uncharacterized protein YbjT (DUF2867 family)
MTNSDKTILVTGATGRQGGSVVQELMNQNFTIRALSRTPDSVLARRLSSIGIPLVKGDMSDPSSLDSAMRNCYGVFSIQNYFECGGEKEVLFGKNMADAAKRSNIAHFIYNSVCNADGSTGVPHFETKIQIERYIKSIGLPYTLLRPVKFMENYYIPQVFKGILGGKLFDPIPSGRKHQMIAVEDIAKYVADAFANPEKYLRKTIEIAGDELTNEEVASTMSEVLGIKVKFSRLPLFMAKLVMDKDLYLMFKWFCEKGFTANLAEVKTNYPAVTVTSLREFLLNENWQRWNKRGTV